MTRALRHLIILIVPFLSPKEKKLKIVPFLSPKEKKLRADEPK
jgi:hypothetical protein